MSPWRGSLWSKLFARSPFGPMREHMHKVLDCVQVVPSLLDHFTEGNFEATVEDARRLSQLEHEADCVKTDLRDHLPRSLFLPVDRRDLLNVLESQDAIADCAEDLGVLLSHRPVEPRPDLVEPLGPLRERSIETVEIAGRVIEELDALVEASFTGDEAQKVIHMIDEVSRAEHLADKEGDRYAKALFAAGDDLTPVEFYVWYKIGDKVGDLANYAEKMANRLRLFLAHR